MLNRQDIVTIARETKIMDNEEKVLHEMVRIFDISEAQCQVLLSHPDWDNELEDLGTSEITDMAVFIGEQESLDRRQLMVPHSPWENSEEFDQFIPDCLLDDDYDDSLPRYY